MSQPNDIKTKEQCLEVIRKTKSGDELDRSKRHERFKATQYFSEHMTDFSIEQINEMFEDELVSKMINSNYAKPLLERAIANKQSLKVYHQKWFQERKENQTTLKNYLSLLIAEDNEEQIKAMLKGCPNIVKETFIRTKPLTHAFANAVISQMPDLLSVVTIPESLLIDYYKTGQFSGENLVGTVKTYSHQTHQKLAQILVAQHLKDKDTLSHQLKQAEHFVVGEQTKLAKFLWEMDISPIAYEFIVELQKKDPKLVYEVMASHAKVMTHIPGYNFIQNYLIVELQSSLESDNRMAEIYFGLKEHFEELIFAPVSFHKGVYQMPCEFMEGLLLGGLNHALSNLSIDYESLDEKQKELSVAGGFNVLIDRKNAYDSDDYYNGEENSSIPESLTRCSVQLFKKYFNSARPQMDKYMVEIMDKLLFKRQLEEKLPEKQKVTKLKI